MFALLLRKNNITYFRNNLGQTRCSRLGLKNMRIIRMTVGQKFQGTVLSNCRNGTGTEVTRVILNLVITFVPFSDVNDLWLARTIDLIQ